MTENTQADEGTKKPEEGQEDESAVIRALRSDIKDAKTAVKTAEKAAETAVEDARAQVARESKAQEIVDDLGYPKLTSLVLEKVEGDLTPEGVTEFLTGLGLDAESKGSDGGGEEGEAATVADVANLGKRLASTSRGADTFADELAQTKTPEEAAAVAAKHGMVVPE